MRLPIPPPGRCFAVSSMPLTCFDQCIEEARIIMTILEVSMASNRKNSKKTALRLQDPFLSREKAKYDNPLPSREFILELLEKNGVPMHAEELAAAFPIYEHELDLFERRLRAMERAGQILINRKGELCVAEKIGRAHV